MPLEPGFRARLTRRQKDAGTLGCVGLDPLVERLPKCCDCPLCPVSSNVGAWMFDIAKAAAPYTSMFKPQSAHWEAIPDGINALQRLITLIHRELPGIPVLLDCKRGDISRTQQQYRAACLDMLGADGMNFSPYMGKDCMAALVNEETAGKALVGLCYTSNPDARQIQDALMQDGRPLWMHVAEWTLGWATELNVLADAGLVMAAAYENPKGSGTIYSEHLARCRHIVGDEMWFLIPGIGTQCGFVRETVRTAYTGPGSVAISSSSEIDFASAGEDYAEAAANKARELRDTINAAL